MASIKNTFVKGRMNKSDDERLIPNGEYVESLNVRANSTENSNVGSLENSKGNTKITALSFLGTALSENAVTIGAIERGELETIIWMVHDPSFAPSPTGKLDMIVSYNENTNILKYHVISTDDGGGVNTTLNFNPNYLITGINVLDDLLLFTDDYNQPRMINLKTNYEFPDPLGLGDRFSEESIAVIKRPPIQSPSISTFIAPNQENYLEDRFICFAYRYKYADNQYSAISQWSKPVFRPEQFNISLFDSTNNGMKNSINGARISIDTGSELVKEIDILFKEIGSNLIKVAEKLNKKNLGISNNDTYTYDFSKNKVFTVLPDSEILRLYDNVPRLAKAQTIMGNRLMYGNYLEGYDLVDVNGNPTLIDYSIEAVSEEIGFKQLSNRYTQSTFSVDVSNYTIPNSRFFIDLTGMSLIKGASISISFNFIHEQWSSGSLSETTPLTTVQFQYILPQDFNSVYELANSQDFIDKIGTVSDVPNACNGVTMTDNFNCALPESLLNSTTMVEYEKNQTGYTALGQPIQIISSPTSQEIGFQILATEWVDDPAAITSIVYEYYRVLSVEALFLSIESLESLRSNRDYSVGIIYMDDYNRASTALISDYSSVHIPCSSSDTKNNIQVTIPPNQIAPYWATRYKFAVKQDKENYEVIYSSIYFKDSKTGYIWFALDGQSSRKVEVGDILQVKADSNGPLNSCVTTEVLDKGAKEADFIEVFDSNGTQISVPAGTYMKLKPSDYNVSSSDNPYITSGELCYTAKNETYHPLIPSINDYPIVLYPVGGFEVPIGSRINLKFSFERDGSGDGNNSCEKRYYTLDLQLTSQANYSNFRDWWIGDNIESLLNTGVQDVGGNGCDVDNVFDSTFDANPPQTDLCTNFFKFIDNSTSAYKPTGGASPYQDVLLAVTGTKTCSFYGKGKHSSVCVEITIINSDTTLIFETQPSDALPDVWFESSESFAIDALGNHMGNVQNQDITIGQSAIINTDFFNCYCFGNGVESYKILDSVNGKELLLGNRVTSTSSEDYREIRRFSDITYSGVYNNESNVNKLNEFNLGLLNFKQLERIYGPIYILDGRATDILALQEDKISYVYTGKNILSDAIGGGTIASIPEVLGNQVARVEEYGISFHPESYTKWGSDKFFTDTKRGAVLNLKGSSGQNEQLIVVSNFKMDSWFRDSFIESQGTQKLGAYDPYMDEYVLSSNDKALPVEEECASCGTYQSLTLLPNINVEYCVELGNIIGDVQVDYFISQQGEEGIVIDADYNGVIVSTGPTSTNGSITVNKNSFEPTTLTITAYTLGSIANIEIGVSCPQTQEITIFQVAVSNNIDGNKLIHNEYEWVDGTSTSPLNSNQIVLATGTDIPLISQYESKTGQQGTTVAPSDNGVVSIISNKRVGDNFSFNTSKHKLRWHRSSVLYDNNTTDIDTLLGLSTAIAVSSSGVNRYSGTFNMSGSSGQYLYLIYDYRESYSTPLCYSSSSIFDVACNCSAPTQNFIVQRCSSVASDRTFVLAGDSGAAVGNLITLNEYSVDCIFQVIGTTADLPNVTLLGFSAAASCFEVCNTYDVANNSTSAQTFYYTDCTGVQQSVLIAGRGSIQVCARTIDTYFEGMDVNHNQCGCV